MENSLENKLTRVRLISRLVFFVSILLMMSSIYSMRTEYIKLIRILIGFGVGLFVVYWIMPVLFLLMKKPAFALAWSRGLAKWQAFKKYKFDIMPAAEKIWMYMNFLLSCVMLVIFVLFLGLINL